MRVASSDDDDNSDYDRRMYNDYKSTTVGVMGEAGDGSG